MITLKLNILNILIHTEFCICFKYFSLLTTNTFLMEVLKHISFSYFSYDNKEERDDNPL